MNIPLNKVLPNPEQPRKMFDKLALQELADSIKENDVILPIVVEEAANGMYILHDGERRLRAAKMAGLTEIPAVVSPPLNGAGRESRLVRAMVVNLQRADLNPIEEANAYQRMQQDLDMPVITIARKIGVSSARISQRLELLKLERPVQQLIAAGRLPKDHRVAKALLAIPNLGAQIKTAQALAERNASIKSSIEACDRVIGALAAAAIPEGETPALLVAVKKSGSVNRPLWDACHQIGRVPPWSMVEKSARRICDRCGLREQASDTVCRGCPLVEMLSELIGKTNTYTALQGGQNGH